MPLVCAAIVWSGLISVRADDTPAQAAARAALEQKMREAGSQDKDGIFFVPTTNSDSQAQTPPSVAVTASGVSETSGTNNLSAAEMALHAKMAELNAPVKNAQSPPPTADSGDIEKARAALEEKMSELNQQSVKTPAPVASKPTKPLPEAASPAPAKPVAPETQPAAEKPLTPADVNYPGLKLGLKPIEAPSLGVSAEVQSKLRDLDAKYKAGEITPEEYHTQRAAVLGQP